MKEFVFVGFNEGRGKYSFIKALLERIDCQEGLIGEDGFLCGLYQRTFDADDPRLQRLRDTLKTEGIEWSERIDHEYSDAELRTYPFLCLTVNRSPLEGGGPEYGTVYDLSAACPRCGTGAVQTSPIMLRRSEIPKKAHLCETCKGQIIVSAKVADILRAEKVSGLELRQVHSCRKNEPLPWWQMISTYEMPRMSELTKGIVRDTDPGWGCPVCLRDCYGHTMKQPPEITYHRHEADPENLPDVVSTWECFGRSMLKDDPDRHFQQGFAQPLLLVKPRVFDIFRKIKVRGARLSPVWITE